MSRGRADDQGEFLVDTLLPGVRFYLMAGTETRSAVVSLPLLEAGEVHNLGNIILKARQ